MEIKFFGRGAGFFPKYGNNSAYITSGDELYLIDCGGYTFEKLVEWSELDKFKKIYCLITHLHADHTGGLGTFVIYCDLVLKVKAVIVHPVPTIKQLLSLHGLAEDAYDYQPSLPIESSVKATAVPVQHVDVMECFGYTFETGDQYVYYSGDANTISPQIIADLENGKISRIYQDTSMYVTQAHCYYKDLEKLIAPEFRDKVYCMHLDHDNAERELEQLGFNVVAI
ncbi:MAG: hypothetical protein ATN35_05095 [Epulopiscium sp. Nele67-Bin004]|nr:MAG: hypothetical protein ATN35_05095 [Epulopiscium sp. Nele67-Bin004]